MCSPWVPWKKPGIRQPIFFHHHLRNILWCEWCVVGKIQLVLMSCLTMRQSCELLCIAETKLYLESWAVGAQHILTRHGCFCGEEKFVSTIRHHPNNKTHFLLQCLWIGYKCVGISFKSINMHFYHSCEIKFLIIDFAVKCFRTSPFLRTWPHVHIV